MNLRRTSASLLWLFVVAGCATGLSGCMEPPPGNELQVVQASFSWNNTNGSHGDCFGRHSTTYDFNATLPELRFNASSHPEASWKRIAAADVLIIVSYHEALGGCGWTDLLFARWGEAVAISATEDLTVSVDRSGRVDISTGEEVQRGAVQTLQGETPNRQWSFHVNNDQPWLPRTAIHDDMTVLSWPPEEY